MKIANPAAGPMARKSLLAVFGATLLSLPSQHTHAREAADEAVATKDPAPLAARSTAQGGRVRLTLGTGVALSPAFAAALAGADWFVCPTVAVGGMISHTLAGVGDQYAIEDGYGFATAMGRWRPRPTEPRPLALEVFGGVGLARIRFGRPGAHSEYAPDLVLGAAVDLPLATGFPVAFGFELTTHITFGQRTGTRNFPQASLLAAMVLRFFGP